DEIRIGQQRIDLPRPGIVELTGPLFIRKGSAALGIRILWSSDLTGVQARVALVDDGNRLGALRLTVAHHSFWGVEKKTASAGAAFWLRIGSGLDTVEEFDAWQRGFVVARMNVETSDKSIRLDTEGRHGPLRIETSHPYYGVKGIVPAPTRGVLEINGKGVGTEFLSGFGFESVEQAGKVAEVVELSAEKGVYWEAEAGSIQSPMLKTTEENEGAITYVWMPGRIGASGGNISGSVTWKLSIPAEGTYYLWGRLHTPTPSDDSFWVRAFSDLSDIIPTADWHTGTHEEWEWAPIILGKERAHTGFAFPKAGCFLQLRVREDGAKIDKLFASPKKSELPR
ncbi:MAG: hypothetical protein QF886_17480, partial [Planctomycetota bacterium]|nr:hypothetical protein [Planctomycetota bacterium]